MRKIVYICDRCKKEIGESHYELVAHKTDSSGDFIIDEIEDDYIRLLVQSAQLELCEDCLKTALERVFEVDDPKPPVELKLAPVAELEPLEELKPKAAEVKTKQSSEAKKKPRVKIDTGKMLALYKAGWMQKNIAEELGVAPSTISKLLNGGIKNE